MYMAWKSAFLELLGIYWKQEEILSSVNSCRKSVVL